MANRDMIFVLWHYCRQRLYLWSESWNALHNLLKVRSFYPSAGQNEYVQDQPARIQHFEN